MKIRIWLTAIPLLLACPGGAFAAQNAGRRALTHEDAWLMKRVGAPVPSPDGKWVVFSVTEPAYDDQDQVTDLWMVPADGSAPARRLTSTKSAESSPAWRPDSRAVAFTAKREGDEVNQIYVIDVGGGEAVRITNLSTGTSSPDWSPDGKTLLFTSMVYPGTKNDEENKKIAAERKARKYNARVYEGFPIRYWDRWLDDKQIRLFIQPAQPEAEAKDLLASTNLVKASGFGGGFSDTGQNLDAVWSPDGKSIVFAATTDRDKAAYAFSSTHLYALSLDGGEPRQLTSGKDRYGNPKFRPDGKALYCVVNSRNGQVYTLDRLAVFSWPALDQRTIATERFDRSVNSFAFSPDSTTVYVTAEDAGLEKIYSVPAMGGEVTPVLDTPSGVYTRLASAEDAASTILVANWQSAVNPAEVVRINLSKKGHDRLSEFTVQKSNEIDWRPLQHFWFTSKGGKKIHNMLVLPPAFDESKQYPLLALLHGGPHSMWRDYFFVRWNYHLLAQPGYVVLLTNYTGSTGFGEKFAQEIQGDPLAGPGEEINEAVDEAIRKYKFIDGGRLAAGGASYGGHLANWLQATTTRYRCLISHAGLINLESQWGTSDTIYHREVNLGGPYWENDKLWRKQNPIRFAKDFRTPMLLTVGEKDFRVPLNQTLENWSILQRLRIPSKLIVFPDQNHWIMKGEDSLFFYQEVHAWLKRWLLGDT